MAIKQQTWRYNTDIGMKPSSWPGILTTMHMGNMLVLWDTTKYMVINQPTSSRIGYNLTSDYGSCNGLCIS